MLDATAQPRVARLRVPVPRANVGRRMLGVSIGVRIGWILWAASALLMALITASLRLLLPAKFFYDSAHIADIARRGLAVGQGDRSFVSVGEFYNILRLQDSPQLTAALSLIALLAIHSVVFLRLARSGRIPLPGLLVLVGSLAICTVYLTSYSKDVVVLLVSAACLIAPRRLGGDLVVVGAVLVYALCFRDYWQVVALGYVALRVVDLLVRRRWIGLLVPVALIVLVAVGYWAAGHGSITSARTLANAARAGSADASTMIAVFVPLPEPWGGIVNSVITLASFVLPVPLLAKGSLYYAAVAVVFTLFWITMCSTWLRRPARSAGAVLAARALSLVLAFTAVQALFEPDYGSALRHLSPLLPLLAMAVAVTLTERTAAATDAPTRAASRGRHLAA